MIAISRNVARKTPRPRRPNIVFIVADDLGFQDVGFRGSNILTPNIDRLASKGVILENHYVMPTCSPSRTSLMTGRYAIRTGFWKGNIKPTEEWGLRLNETTMAEMLKRNGYATHGIGKWHCGMYTWDHTPVKRGFDTFFGLYLGAQDYYKHNRARGYDLRDVYYNNQGQFVETMREDLRGQYNTDLFTDRAVRILREHPQSTPLFLYLAYTAPHWPYNPPPSTKRFPPGSTRQKYAAIVSRMDQGVGRVVEVLKQRSLMENTIIVFMSDNGAVMRFVGGPNFRGSNYPLRGGKQSLFEGGVRAVSFVSSPLLQKTGYVNKNLHHVTDWYATFQKMAGDQPTQHSKPQLPIDGVDIWDSVSSNLPCREEVLMNFRDHSKIQDSIQHETSQLDRLGFNLNITGVIMLDYSQEDNIHDNESGDVFVLRWKNWKLFHGTFLVQSWTSANNNGGDSNFRSSTSGELHRTALATGTLLFDLETDPREEVNVADKKSGIVNVMLDI
ncbi:hypothetical protein ACHWQZ_G005412 [Mnemiopsis leidyi]